MMIKNMLATAIFSATFSVSIFAQSPVDLVGKPMSDVNVSKFVNDNVLDATTGISYTKGIQVFQDQNTLYRIYLFNATNLNGNDMAAYQGLLPFQVTFKDSPDVLKKKISGIPVVKDGHYIWDMKTYNIDVSYADDKKTTISYVLLEKK